MFVSKVLKAGRVAPACNPHTQKAEGGGCEFEASLDYKVRSYLKQTDNIISVHCLWVSELAEVA